MTDVQTNIDKSINVEHAQKKKWKNLTRTRKILVCCLIILSSGVIFYGGVRIGNYRSTNGTAKWEITNGQKYLSVSAQTNYELGYLTGKNIAKQISSLKMILYLSASKYDLTYSKLIEMAKGYLPLILEAQKTEFQGLADGASNALGIFISFNDILLQNCWIDLVYGRIFPILYSPVACTTIGVKNSNNSTMIGQNFDFIKSFESCLSFVLHKLPNQPAIFSLRMGASLNIPLGKTTNDLYVFVTVVRSNVQAEFMIPVTCRTRIAFETATNVSTFFDSFFVQQNLKQSLSFTLMIADCSNLVAIEVLPNQYNASQPIKKVQTNTYTIDAFQPYLSDQIFSKDRQKAAESKLDDYFTDNYLTESELYSILEQRPEIVQMTQNKTGTETLAFLSQNYFGLGAPNRNNYGSMPI